MLLFLLASAFSETERVIATCIVKGGVPEITVCNDSCDYKSSHAWADWQDSINQTGWYNLHVTGIEGVNSDDMLLCGGALEGYLSQERIFDHYRLIKEMEDRDFDGNKNPEHETQIQNTLNFFNDNLLYIRGSIYAYPEVPYWREIALIMKQFDGFVIGYNKKADITAKTSEIDPHLNETFLWLIQSEGDLGDVMGSVPAEATNRGPTREIITPGEHCSGLIRLLDNYGDIFFSHDAWSDYRELHGELKEYNFPIPDFKAHRITMSTRVGKLASYDDYYVSDAGLFVLETTLNNFNEELSAGNVKPQTLFTWIRAVHATWCTDNGKDWTDTFIKHNSGTYNNQYIVLDSKKFKRFEKPTTDLLWIIEQMPGIYRSKDITDQLVNEGYFPSFNTPWFEDIFNIAHYPQHIAEWGEDGSYWDYYTAARYLIYKREMPRITDFDAFKQMMIYNNWKKDLYSNGDPGQQILSRYDQRMLGFHKEHWPRRAFGGLDSKCLKLTEATARLHFHARASPPYENNPVWEFGTEEWKDIHYYGLPKRWNFTWQTFSSYAPDKCAGHKGKECTDIEGCGYCTSTHMCTPGDKEGSFFEKCEDGWSIKQEEKSYAVPLISVTCVVVFIFCAIVYGTHYCNVKKKKNTL